MMLGEVTLLKPTAYSKMTDRTYKAIIAFFEETQF